MSYLPTYIYTYVDLQFLLRVNDDADSSQNNSFKTELDHLDEAYSRVEALMRAHRIDGTKVLE